MKQANTLQFHNEEEMTAKPIHTTRRVLEDEITSKGYATNNIINIDLLLDSGNWYNCKEYEEMEKIMGQYFYAVTGNDTVRTNYRKRGGLKLLEHSWIGNYFTEFVASRIYKKPQRVAWVGNYAELQNAPCKEAKQFWQTNPVIVNKIWIKDQNKNNTTMFDITKKYLINHSQKLYIDMAYYCILCNADNGSIIHPLPILTCMSNQQSRSDYYGLESEKAGSWAWNVLEIADKHPIGYQCVSVHFINKK